MENARPVDDADKLIGKIADEFVELDVLNHYNWAKQNKTKSKNRGNSQIAI